MADTITPERRSEIMSHIKSKDTSIELMVVSMALIRAEITR